MSIFWLELVGESILSIQSSEKVTSISLPPTPPYHTLEFKLEVLCVIPSGTDHPNNERLTNGEVRHRPRSYSHPDTPMTAIDQRVRIFFMCVFRAKMPIMSQKRLLEGLESEGVIINCVSFCWDKKNHERVWLINQTDMVSLMTLIDLQGFFFVRVRVIFGFCFFLAFIRGVWHKPGFFNVHAEESLTILRWKCFEETKSPSCTVCNYLFLESRDLESVYAAHELIGLTFWLQINWSGLMC